MSEVQDLKSSINQIEAEIKERYKEVQSMTVSYEKTKDFTDWVKVQNRELAGLKRRLKHVS